MLVFNSFGHMFRNGNARSLYRVNLFFNLLKNYQTFPPTAYEGFSFSTSSSTFVIAIFWVKTILNGIPLWF
jgi:hypothetical protein